MHVQAVWAFFYEWVDPSLFWKNSVTRRYGVIYNGSDEREKVLRDIQEDSERDGIAGGDKFLQVFGRKMRRERGNKV